MPPRPAQSAPEATTLAFQAVDAGTGGPLADGRFTVRHLVRTPITLDDAGTEVVPATREYEITHEVGTDSLVVELRLEAPSYHRLDTVLAVARGVREGPFTLRMARRLAGAAAAGSSRPSRPRPAAGDRASGAPAGGGASSGGGAAGVPGESPASGAAGGGAAAPASAAPDRSAMRRGDAAFRQGSWLAAADAYREMPEPRDPASDYARDYQDALVRRAVAHINLGEYGGALDALEAATDLNFPNAEALLRLGQVQCAVGRIEEGRGTLARVQRVASRIPKAEQPVVKALAEYERARCSQTEFDKARGAVQVVRTGGQAIREFQAFLDQAGALSDPPSRVTDAVADAEKRIEAIRERVKRGG